MILKARQFTFAFPRPPLVMGILNVTPDSFSDGGLFLAPALAVEHALQMAAQGADIIDIGGESTRPGAAPVPESEELRRVMPVLEALAGRLQIPISIDTLKPGVARTAVAAGASIINDVGANRQDTAMWQVAAETGAAYVLMHMQGNPQTMQDKPFYADVVAEVRQFFTDHLARLDAFGLPLDQVLLDVGIGFGKSQEHNLQLLAALRSFITCKRPLLLGVSRKSFIGRVTGAMEASGRLPGSLACVCWAATAGVNIIRTHDVAPTRQALQMLGAIMDHTK